MPRKKTDKKLTEGQLSRLRQRGGKATAAKTAGQFGSLSSPTTRRHRPFVDYGRDSK